MHLYCLSSTGGIQNQMPSIYTLAGQYHKIIIPYFNRTTKFYGNANLGNIIKKDGIIYGYLDTPFSINGDDSKVCIIVL